GAQYILHLAGYYDFTYDDHPEYRRTNVHGTENVLALADVLDARHFIFASSLAACSFPQDGEVITEDTAPDADFPYARSKREAEALIREHESPYVRSIVRFAALYSDWCEYPPAYEFLKTWSSGRWNSRLLGGRGKSAVPYLHIKDLIALLFRVIEETDRLPACAVYNASPNHTTSHEEMYRAAMKFFIGRPAKPLHIPRLLAWPGVAVRQFVMDLIGKPPFERTWMMRYIDRDLRVDAQRTEKALGWKSAPRYDLTRRLLILIDNMKSHPEVWRQLNEAALLRAATRPNLVLYERLLRLRDTLIERIYQDIRLTQLADEQIDYRTLSEGTLLAYVSLFYEVLITTIRTRDRAVLRTHARIVAYHRYRQKFKVCQVCEALSTFGRQIRAALAEETDLPVTPELLHDELDLCVQLACDEVEEVYDSLRDRGDEGITIPASVDLLSNSAEMQRLVDELNDICRDGWDIKGMLGKATGKVS
ncbi:MAG: NAD(P)-dependent oxidoreductase, partial [Bacteroidetes bacterium]|nr:NAD(P)-dependent oxidoreductase [Bacteroidota bacterium]